MKFILLYAFGLLSGVILLAFVLKSLDLVTVIGLHGLRAAALSESVNAYRDGENVLFSFPKGTTLYLARHFPDKYSQYVVFVNYEGADLPVQKTDVIAPLLAVP